MLYLQLSVVLMIILVDNAIHAIRDTRSIYMVRMVMKTKTNAGFTQCVSGTTSNLFNVPRKSSETKYFGNLIDFTNHSFCGNYPTLVGPEAVVFALYDRHCNYSLHIQKIENVKFLVLLSNEMYGTPKYLRFHHTDPLVMILDKTIFMENVKLDELFQFKFGIFFNVKLESRTPHILACLAMGLIITFTIIVISSITITYHQDLIDMISNIGHLQRNIAYVIAALLSIGGNSFLFFHETTYVWINIVTFWLFGSHATAFCLNLLLENRAWFKNLRSSIDINQFDHVFFVLFLIGSILPTAWIFNRNIEFGNYLNIVIGILICVELSIIIGMLLATDRRYKIMIVFYCLLVIIYLASPLIIMGTLEIRRRLSFVNNAKPITNCTIENFPTRFKVPVKYFQGDITECQFLFRDQVIIHHYVDIIMSGSVIVYLLLFFSTTKQLVNKYLYGLIGGFSFGVLLYFILFLTIGNFPLDNLFITACVVIPALLFVVWTQQIRELLNNSWAKQKPSRALDSGDVLISLSQMSSPEDPMKV